MKVHSSYKPDSFEYEVINSGKTSLLRFIENITPDNPDNENTLYTSDQYRLERDFEPDLEEQVKANIPIWLEFAKEKEIEKLSAEVRQHRDALLTATDHTQTLDAPLTTECKLAFRAYRQELRDITARAEFPYIESWPEKPELIKAAPDPVDESIPPQVTDMQIALCEVYETVATLGGV